LPKLQAGGKGPQDSNNCPFEDTIKLCTCAEINVKSSFYRAAWNADAV